MKKVIVVILGVILVYCVTLVVVTGTYKRNLHQDAYSNNYYMQFTDRREQVVSLALHAPSSHNMQPWRLVLDPSDESKMYLYINHERVLPIVDENYNQMVISSGTFIAYAVEAGKELGFDVTYDMFPEGELVNAPSKEDLNNTPIAMISVEKATQEVTPEIDGFTSATVKGVFSENSIDKGVIDGLSGYQTDHITIRSINDDLDTIRGMLISGVEIESQNEEIMKETSSIFRYTKTQKNQYKYGLSMNSSFNNKLLLTNIEFLNQLFPMTWDKEGKMWLENEVKNINSCNDFIVIYGDNSRTSQLESGIAFGHIYYDLKKLNISVQPIVQLTELYDEMSVLRSDFNESYANNQETHLIFRLGYVERYSLTTMRLNTDDLID